MFSFLWIGSIFLTFRLCAEERSQLKILHNGNLSDCQPRETSSQEPLHLVYASDDGSLPGVEASIRSVMCHASEPVVFHYIGDTPLASLPEVNFYNLTKVAKEYKLKEFMNPHERHDEGVHGLIQIVQTMQDS